MNTYICAPTDASATARAALSNVADGFKRVGPDPKDVATVEGGLLFAHDWRDTFKPPSEELGVVTGMDISAFLQAAHSNPKLAVELTI